MVIQGVGFRVLGFPGNLNPTRVCTLGFGPLYKLEAFGLRLLKSRDV